MMTPGLVRKLNSERDEVHKLFGVRYLDPGSQEIIHSKDDDLYTYQVYFGTHAVKVEKGDCAFTISEDRSTAHLKRGPVHFKSTIFAAVVRGYSPDDKSSTIVNGTNLPYVNGCSTRQVFPPERPGDPTLQLLRIPPHSSEQAHHIHSTARIVYVTAGFGHSVVGMKDKFIRTELKPGMLCILDRMCPHHFETQEAWLEVLPVHVWSSTGAQEHHHPMFNGTFMLE